MAASTMHHQPLLQTHNNDHSPNTSTTSSRKAIYAVLSLVAIISPTVLIAFHLNHSSSSSSSTFDLASSAPVPPHLCERSINSTSCLAMISKVVTGEGLQLGRLSDSDFLQIFLEKSVSRFSNAMKVVNGFNGRSNDFKEQAALANCVELMDLSIDRVIDSVMALKTKSTQSHADAHAWLSAVLTNYDTCLDGITESTQLNESTRIPIEMELDDLMARARTSLAMISAISPSDYDESAWLTKVQLPSWVTMRDRKLLEAGPNAITANVVVAQDGSGKYKSVQQAVTAAPDNSKTRYVIHVKKGIYKEKVEIGKKKKNIMLVGDGMDSTIITGSLNVIDGSTTFNSATVVVVGDGFIGEDICFQNTAGPQKHQAVAIRVGADQTVFNRCKMDAYQDTLYAHSLRQFYRDCSIIGTVDFIFGNAAMVIQNSKIIARKAMKGQNNMNTAQGRTDPNQNTAISIQNCNVIPTADLIPVQNIIKTYLGRPWKLYSRTVYMESFMADHIAPAGWAEWNGDFALKTLYYAEYANKGPGAGTSKRVKWPGYHVLTNPNQAKPFTVAQLIQGGVWLKSTGVAFTEGL